MRAEKQVSCGSEAEDYDTNIVFKKCLNKTRLALISFFAHWEFAKPLATSASTNESWGCAWSIST